MAFLSVEPLLEDLGEIDLTGIDWVIVGGESGAGARPMQAEWVENIQRQCESASVPFFFKQWGGVRKKLAGRELNGRTYDEHPPVVRGKCRIGRGGKRWRGSFKRFGKGRISDQEP
jgi:protein gp37